MGLFLLHWPVNVSICLVPLESFPLLYVQLVTTNAHECSNSNYTPIYFTKTFFAKCDSPVTSRIGTSDSGVAEHSDRQGVLRVAIGCWRSVVPSSIEGALRLLVLTIKAQRHCTVSPLAISNLQVMFLLITKCAGINMLWRSDIARAAWYCHHRTAGFRSGRGILKSNMPLLVYRT
jgi:hypothetical protein